MIPKRIFTHWLNDNPSIPEMVRACIETQKISGYEHVLVTLDNCYRGSTYVNECLEAKQWVKASDWLRIWNLYSEGGIYLDGDMAILPGKNFDTLLGHRLFLSKEVGGYWANAALGAEKGHPTLKRYLDRVEHNFKGSGDDVFSPGIRCFTDVFWEALRGSSSDRREFFVDQSRSEQEGIFECPVSYFFPFNHITGTVEVTPETIVYHHYMKSWKPPLDRPIPAKNDFRFNCGTYHLGDQLFALWFLGLAAERFPNSQFSFWVEPRFYDEVKALARKLPNLEVTSRFDNHTRLEWWHGDWAVHMRNPDREHFVDSMAKLQIHLASKFGLEPWELADKQKFLFQKECLKRPSQLDSDRYDVLFINSTPMSWQCIHYNPDQVNWLARSLKQRGLSVIATHPCGDDEIPVTTDLGLSLAHIGELASRCRFVVGVANAPFIATFNELAFKTVEKWVNYGCDVLNFDDRVIGASTMGEFETAIFNLS
jgi:hypothetical protein